MIEIERAAKKFKELYEREGLFLVVSHLDADGLSSAAIFANLLLEADQPFLIKILKRFDLNLLKLESVKALVLLDFGSNKLKQLQELAINIPIFVVDHHQLDADFSKASVLGSNLFLIHNETTSASALSYFFAKQLGEAKEQVKLAIVGFVGDQLDKQTSPLSLKLIEEAVQAGVECKKSLSGLSSKPLHQNLGTFGISTKEAIDLLKETGILGKTAADLSEQEVSRLITAILLKQTNAEVVAPTYRIKLAGRFWDARELSAVLNALGRLGHPGLALELLLGKCPAEVEKIYSEYKAELVKAFKLLHSAEIQKIEGKNYLIINFLDKLKDTLVGTFVSILAASSDLAVLVGIASSENKLKVSCRTKGLNAFKLLSEIVKKINETEVGGHSQAAGCLIPKEKLDSFISFLEKTLKEA